MPAVHIRDLSPEVVDALKRRAARHERSLEGELRFLLTSVAREEPPAQPLPAIRLHLAASAEPGAAAGEPLWRREEIYGDEGR